LRATREYSVWLVHRILGRQLAQVDSTGGLVNQDERISGRHFYCAISTVSDNLGRTATVPGSTRVGATVSPLIALACATHGMTRGELSSTYRILAILKSSADAMACAFDLASAAACFNASARTARSSLSEN